MSINVGHLLIYRIIRASLRGVAAAVAQVRQSQSLGDHLIRFLGQLFVSSDVCYLNGREADTLLLVAIRLSPLDEMV
jgi:hypothetical protein